MGRGKLNNPEPRNKSCSARREGQRKERTQEQGKEESRRKRSPPNPGGVFRSRDAVDERVGCWSDSGRPVRVGAPSSLQPGERGGRAVLTRQAQVRGRRDEHSPPGDGVRGRAGAKKGEKAVNPHTKANPGRRRGGRAETQQVWGRTGPSKTGGFFAGDWAVGRSV